MKGITNDSPEHVRFQPWVRAYLLKSAEEKLSKSKGAEGELKTIRNERLRMEKMLRKIPPILVGKLKRKLKLPAKPKISVITPSFNQEKFLENCINSIANQTFRNFEHIVTDGKSTDKTVSILKQNSHIRWISEKDSGYNEAMKKGLNMAKGEYILNCAVSDAYADRKWFQRCVDILDKNLDIAMVWGFPQNLSEDNIPGKIFYSYFHLSPAPQKVDWFYFWLRTGHAFPEGNLCVRKSVLLECLPGIHNHSDNYHIWKEFAYNFGTKGYLSFHIPVVANFGRAHKNQLGQKDQVTGLEKRLQSRYMRNLWRYRWLILFRLKTHVFRNGRGRAVSTKFSSQRFWQEYLGNYRDRIKYQIEVHLPRL